MKKSKKAKAVKATFPLEADLKPYVDRIRMIYRKLELDLDGEIVPFLAESHWSQNLTNAQLADLTERFRAYSRGNSAVSLGLWEVRNRLMRRPNAKRVSPKNAKREALILRLPEPS